MIFKRLLFIIFCLTIFDTRSFADTKSDSARSSNHYKNAIFLELGGPTLVYSLGYERTFYQHHWFSAIGSVGASYIPDGVSMGYIEPGILFRSKNVALELGAGLMSYTERPHNGIGFATNDESSSAKKLVLTTRAGLRFFTKNQHLHFRFGITPLKEIWNNQPKGWAKDNQFFLWLNVFTLGYRF